MIRTADLHDVCDARDLVPQAVFGVDVFALARRFKSEVVRDHDDFDEYVGLGFWLTDFGLPFAVKHYAGHPEHTSTVYLPHEIQDVGRIADIIHVIAKDFDISDKQIVWQRKLDPEL
jgi:hypothetical protein